MQVTMQDKKEDLPRRCERCEMVEDDLTILVNAHYGGTGLLCECCADDQGYELIKGE